MKIEIDRRFEVPLLKAAPTRTCEKQELSTIDRDLPRTLEARVPMPCYWALGESPIAISRSLRRHGPFGTARPERQPECIAETRRLALSNRRIDQEIAPAERLIAALINQPALAPAVALTGLT